MSTCEKSHVVDCGCVAQALEEACKELGLKEEQIAAMLRPGGDYIAALLQMISIKTGCSVLDRIRRHPDSQKVIWC